jgi:hypothetical protein
MPGSGQCRTIHDDELPSIANHTLHDPHRLVKGCEGRFSGSFMISRQNQLPLQLRSISPLYDVSFSFRALVSHSVKRDCRRTHGNRQFQIPPPHQERLRDWEYVFARGVGDERVGRQSLELHLMWSLAVSQAEAGGEVAGEEFLVLDGGKNGLVDRLLVRSTF